MLSLPPGKIEWEMHWEKVAFVPPYVFGFCDDLVEVRNIYSGALVQILKIEGEVRHLSCHNQATDWRAATYGTGEDAEDLPGGGLTLRECGPVVLTSENYIVQLTPRSFPDSLNPRLFDVEFQFKPS